MSELPPNWLGLLKWSLAQTDGTSNEPVQSMSESDRKFLESVMKDGIIDEGARMKEILARLSANLDSPSDSPSSVSSEEQASIELLEELNDIVEQIDFARSFALHLLGVPLLLKWSCNQEISTIVRCKCLGVVAACTQNNPPVQEFVMEGGAMDILVDLYWREEEELLLTRTLGAISCLVRECVAAEDEFCSKERCRKLVESALGSESNKLLNKCLFFLRALICSDASTMTRVRIFNNSIRKMIGIVTAENAECIAVENSLQSLLLIMRQKKSVDEILDHKGSLVSKGVARVTQLRLSQQPDSTIELELWEDLIVELARGRRDQASPMIAAVPIHHPPQNLPQ